MRSAAATVGLWLALAAAALACGGGAAERDATAGLADTADGAGDAVGLDAELAPADPDAADGASDGDGGSDPADADDAWAFDRDAYAPVLGWILLDADPAAVSAAIEAAAARGATQIQLSHDLVMNVEDVLGDDAATLARVELLNDAIALAHARGLQALVWAHELSGVDAALCYAPDDPVWTARQDAYRQTFARLPGLDGVVLMFGSAPVPPWFSLCACEACFADDPDASPFLVPEQDARLRLITEKVGDVVVRELGRSLLVRTFVHQPQELAWHADGLSAVEGVAFTGMHKGPVQDWQPYNPHHPNTGHIGPHPSVVELDVAGEYFGRAILPWCAPGYYRYRMEHMWEHRGIGAVVRVERGSDRALGTPNEVNLYAVERFMADRDTPLADVWDGFLASAWGVAPDAPGQEALVRILADTFPVRRKSHYALGIWALDKGSDLPSGPGFSQLDDRGKMPKWDPDWQETWERVAEPDVQSVRWIWQEGSEAVALAEEDLAAFDALPEALLPEARRADLGRRLAHQAWAARAWRAVDLFLFARKARQAHADPLLDTWQRWAFAELGTVREGMLAAGLGDVGLAGPARVQAFRDAVQTFVPAGDDASPPGSLALSPIRVSGVGPTSATLRFRLSEEVPVTVDWGLEIPDYGQSTALAALPAGAEHVLTLEGLAPRSRYVVRLRATWDGMELRGGDFWIFTEPAP